MRISVCSSDVCSSVLRFGPHLSVGMSAGYHQLYTPKYLSVYAFAVDIEAQYHFEQGSTVGFQYTNVGNADYGTAVYGTIPSFLKVGFSYPFQSVPLSADFASRFAHSFVGHLGLWV